MVFLKQMVELINLFKKDRGKTGSPARGIAELIRLFKKDWGKTASTARILSPNLTWRPLPCLLIKSFFYGCDKLRAFGRQHGTCHISIVSPRRKNVSYFSVSNTLSCCRVVACLATLKKVSQAQLCVFRNSILISVLAQVRWEVN